MRISDWSSDVCSSDLADFIDPEGDWIGGFAVTAGHGIEAHLARFRADHDDYSGILLKAIADRFAEAFAERLHQHVRTVLRGYAEGEQPDNAALIREQYRGIRPAPGYPACRSEQRRVGQRYVSTTRFRCSPYHLHNKKSNYE